MFFYSPIFFSLGSSFEVILLWVVSYLRPRLQLFAALRIFLLLNLNLGQAHSGAKRHGRSRLLGCCVAAGETRVGSHTERCHLSSQAYCIVREPN